mmetsp:Transcript_14332/g.22824  ORF Transcript_14332/g.22824 Transcript_14332/m.22824 type:complete len:280 (-) Transcript_14332:41-880(-)
MAGRKENEGEGSEHYIHGRQYALEIHFVHYNAKYSGFNQAVASGNTDAVLAISQLFSVGLNESRAMSTISETLSLQRQYSPVGTSGIHVEVSAAQLVDLDQGFYAYAGSLTTPGCNAVVTWVVMQKILTVTESTLNVFRGVMDTSGKRVADQGNFRPLQPVGARTVYRSASVHETSWPCLASGTREPIFECESAEVSVPDKSPRREYRHAGYSLMFLLLIMVLGIAFGFTIGVASSINNNAAYSFVHRKLILWMHPTSATSAQQPTSAQQAIQGQTSNA